MTANIFDMPTRLFRWGAAAAVLAGIIFIAIQPFHPADVVASTTTTGWAVTMVLKLAFTVLGLIGITAVYLQQANVAGTLGLLGVLGLGLFFLLQMAVVFVQAVIMPPLAALAPEYVAGALGLITSTPSEVSLGALPVVVGVMGGLYIIGGVIFGIATMRAGVFPRWAGGLLIIAVLSTLLGPLLGHPLDRFLSVPMGIALVWLGLSLWSLASRSTAPADSPDPAPRPARKMNAA